ncbi:response regulator [Acetobacter sacchari]|uniref:protein-glutamate methylesterase n=1 Tax=Acetobacter sacchari TaxID=2661687 RepID=A0ABS3M187_9PROT|nr:response regulator [Acetobacter sacchari]MBO1361948.1 response regulator [Acetobacter sacchari]
MIAAPPPAASSRIVLPSMRVLLVDDDASVRARLRDFLTGIEGGAISCRDVAGAEDAVSLLETSAFDVVVMRADLPGMSGLQATRRIMASRPVAIVVTIAPGSPSLDLAFESLRSGALALVPRIGGQSAGGSGLEGSNGVEEAVAWELLGAASALVCKASRRSGDVSRSDVRGAADGSKLDAVRRTDSAPAKVMALLAGGGALGSALRMLESAGDARPPTLFLTSVAAPFLDDFVVWLNGVAPGGAVRGRAGPIATGPVQVVAVSDGFRVSDSGALVPMPVLSGALGTFAPGLHGASFDMLLSSMAEALRSDAMAVLLGQVEDDGALGLFAIRHAGGQAYEERPARNPFASAAAARMAAAEAVGSAEALGELASAAARVLVCENGDDHEA